jgi:hypothetical protein
MQELGFCTIVTRSHLKYAIALGKALQRYHPHLKLLILTIDFGNDTALPRPNNVELLTLEDVNISAIEDMKIYFNALELANAAKPFLIAHLLQKRFGRLIYLDADILVVNNFDLLFEMLEKHSFILSPHWLYPGLSHLSEVPAIEIADLGVYNGGIWGVRRDEPSMSILYWLMRVLPDFGFDDRGNGMFLDQKLLPLVAQLYSSDFGCIDHPGYNIGYWNLHERKITKNETNYFSNGSTAVCFHMSGFSVERPDRFSRYASWTFERLPVLREIVAEYLSDVPDDPLSDQPYGFSHAGSRKLSLELRRYYFVHRSFQGYRTARLKRVARRVIGIGGTVRSLFSSS